jgi:Tfp pilus assembly major pilin PilA
METNKLLEEWLFRIRRAQQGHYESATHFARLNYWLGVPAIALSAIVGTSVFAALGKETIISIKIAVGVASVTAAILMALQTFLNYPERAEKHRTVATRYGTMRREIEKKLAFPPPKRELEAYIETLQAQWNKCNEDCPTVPKRIWHRTKADMRMNVRRPA